MGLRMILSRINLIHQNSMKIKSGCNSNRSLYKLCGLKNAKVSGNFYSVDSPSKCWNCNYPYKSEIFCKQCKSLQEPPENLNYFQIIGVKEDFDIDGKDLHNRYRSLQNLLHPDRFGNRTKKEQGISKNLSSLINKAYNTLTQPLERGLYMLKLKNISIPEGTTNLNPEFLMEIMERNEKVEEASNNRESIVKLLNDNERILIALSKEVSDAFREEKPEKAKLLLIKMKYYASLQLRLKNLKRELGVVN